MQTVYTIIRDNGDGSSSSIWVRGCTFDELYEAADKDKYDSYQSGDGIQITTIKFPDSWNLDEIQGIYWETLESLFEEDDL